MIWPKKALPLRRPLGRPKVETVDEEGRHVLGVSCLGLPQQPWTWWLKMTVFTLSQFWRLHVQNRGVSRDASFRRLYQKSSPCLSPGSPWHLASLDVALLVIAVLQFPPLPSQCLLESGCVTSLPQPFSQKETVTAFRDTISSGWTHLRFLIASVQH